MEMYFNHNAKGEVLSNLNKGMFRKPVLGSQHRK